MAPAAAPRLLNGSAPSCPPPHRFLFQAHGNKSVHGPPTTLAEWTRVAVLKCRGEARRQGASRESSLGRFDGAGDALPPHAHAVTAGMDGEHCGAVEKTIQDGATMPSSVNIRTHWVEQGRGRVVGMRQVAELADDEDAGSGEEAHGGPVTAAACRWRPSAAARGGSCSRQPRRHSRCGQGHTVTALLLHRHIGGA